MPKNTLCLLGPLLSHNKGVEHQKTPRAKIQRKVDRLCDVAVSARDTHYIASVFFEEETHLHTVSGDDGIVIRLERLTNDRIHSVEPHRARIRRDQSAANSRVCFPAHASSDDSPENRSP